MQLDTEAATLLAEIQQQLNVVLDELCCEFAARWVNSPVCTCSIYLRDYV